MSTPPPWLTVDDVAAYLDLPGDASTDDNLVLSTAAVKAAVEERRTDLVVDGAFTPTEHVHAGAVQWAGLMYQARSSPSGYTGYGDETVLFDSLGSRRSEIMKLLGWNRPVAV